MPKIKFNVPFIQGKGRPRFYNGHAVTPQATRDAERLIQTFYVQASNKKFGKVLIAPKGTPVFVKICIYNPLPKNTPKKIEEMNNVVKPDLDNVAKLVLDALNQCAFEDDAQVVNLSVIKVPRTREIDHKNTKITVNWSEQNE